MGEQFTGSRFWTTRLGTIRLVALGLFSAALFVVELGLTRLFATRYYPPVVFLILSCAILGLGLGAACAAWQCNWRQRRYLPYYVLAVSASTLFAVAALMISGQIALLLPLALVPFFFAGLLLATLFSIHSTASPLLYFADLSGAGCGILLITPLFHSVGLMMGMAVALVLLAAAGALFHLDSKWSEAGASHKTPLGLLILIGILSFIAAYWWSPSAQQLFAEKPIAAKLDTGGTVLATRWDNFARTDLIDPGAGLPYELYLDGAAGSVMPPAAGHRALLRDIGFFPFATEQPARVFVIGPGGGLDLWFGLQSGAQEIVAVEVNPASVDLLTDFGAYNGNLRTQEPVRLVEGEGRSVLAREGRHYDLIFLSQVVTLAAEQSGFALVENHAYTIEAFTTYLAHLRPKGMVALKLYDEPTLIRALATVIEALRTYDLSEQEALAHVIILLDPAHDPAIPLLMVRNEPFTRDELLSIGAVADTVGFRPFFLPGLWAEPPLDAIAAGDQPLAALWADDSMNLLPTTDAQPFFFSFERGIPHSLRPFLGIIGLLIGGGFALLLMFPSRSRPSTSRLSTLRTRPLQLAQRLGYAAYFIAIGMGFMLIEITLIQQTQRFLGHPTMALTVVLATLLIGAGLGSWLIGLWLSPRLPEGWSPHAPAMGTLLPRWPFVGVLLMWASWQLIWPLLSSHFLPFSLAWRIGVVACYLLPLALFLGMPFALGLRNVAYFGDDQVARAWAFNGLASVAGTLLAMLGALLYGYHFVALLGWLCYLVALAWSAATARNSISSP